MRPNRNAIDAMPVMEVQPSCCGCVSILIGILITWGALYLLWSFGGLKSIVASLAVVASGVLIHALWNRR